MSQIPPPPGSDDVKPERPQTDGSSPNEERLNKKRFYSIARIKESLTTTKDWLKAKLKYADRHKKAGSHRAGSGSRSLDESRIGTARRMSMIPMKAPQPVQTSQLNRVPSRNVLTKSASDSGVVRQFSGLRGARTTRAMIEHY